MTGEEEDDRSGDGRSENDRSGDGRPEDGTEIHRIPIEAETRAPTGRTNAYLVVGAESVLVDPGAQADALDAAIEETPPDHVVATHTHPDHVNGLVHYASETNAEVWALRSEETRFAQATGVYPGRTFGDGESIGPLEAVATPGHAPDHVAFEADGRILCGDLAVAEGSVFVGGADGDMAAYLASLRRLRDRNPELLYPAHGPVIDAPIETIDRLLEHRLERERRVLEAIERGASHPTAILEAAYDKDLTGVRDLARKTVVAHVEKLEAEGTVEWDPTIEHVELLASAEGAENGNDARQSDGEEP